MPGSPYRRKHTHNCEPARQMGDPHQYPDYTQFWCPACRQLWWLSRRHHGVGTEHEHCRCMWERMGLITHRVVEARRVKGQVIYSGEMPSKPEPKPKAPRKKPKKRTRTGLTRKEASRRRHDRDMAARAALPPRVVLPPKTPQEAARARAERLADANRQEIEAKRRTFQRALERAQAKHAAKQDAS